MVVTALARKRARHVQEIEGGGGGGAAAEAPNLDDKSATGGKIEPVVCLPRYPPSTVLSPEGTAARCRDGHILDTFPPKSVHNVPKM